MINIFNNCEEIAKNLAMQVTKSPDDSKPYREALLRKIQDNILYQCNAREIEFLDLKIIMGGRLINYIVDRFDVVEGQDCYFFKINPMVISFTDSELNHSSFYFDSGRAEIRMIVNSIFNEKLGIDFKLLFDHNDQYVLSLFSNEKLYRSV